MYQQNYLGNAQDDWNTAFANVHALATTIGEAIRAGQSAAAYALQPQWDYWVGQLKTATVALYGNEVPSSVMQALNTFSDFSIFFVNAGSDVVQQTVAGVATDTAKVSGALAPLLWPIAIGAVAIAYLFYGKKSKRAASTSAPA